MDWKLAKNYTIIFLINLNLILLCANFLKTKQYKVSISQKTAINTYFTKNDIFLYADMPSKFYPMQQLKVKPKVYDYFVLQEIFFNSTSDIKRTEEFNDTIFSKENETLTIYEDYIFYENENTEPDFDTSKANISKICSSYIQKIKLNYAKLDLNRFVEKDDYFLVEYIQTENNFFIFNNYVKFKIYKNGSMQIKMQLFEPLNFFEEKLDISSSDEASYVFVKKIKKIYPKQKIYINQIDLGYFLEEIPDTLSFSLTPYYRFFIQNSDEPFYVNAYTNTFLNSFAQSKE